jgi:DNA-directed RNA polymerase specialized sigma24 family protein
VLLKAWYAGDEAALHKLMPMVYGELRQIARRCLYGEHAAATLQPTALVNEACLRLIEVKQIDWQNRVHFLAMAARVMRRTLVDLARARQADKRGGDARKSRIIELRYFGGLSVEETAEALGVSSKTVARGWTFARAWLLRELTTRRERDA